jgi:hypothetical protein
MWEGHVLWRVAWHQPGTEAKQLGSPGSSSGCTHVCIGKGVENPVAAVPMLMEVALDLCDFLCYCCLQRDASANMLCDNHGPTGPAKLA